MYCMIQKKWYRWIKGITKGIRILKQTKTLGTHFSPTNTHTHTHTHTQLINKH